ncbi:hypothetical protein ACFCXH_01245 [Streptomyces nojiriensis]|uniref:hypothetical protein n=1 Tax=Streptomyces nojiriensis TaxID=66374 RepID=UPI0035D9B4FB
MQPLPQGLPETGPGELYGTVSLDQQYPYDCGAYEAYVDPYSLSGTPYNPAGYQGYPAYEFPYDEPFPYDPVAAQTAPAGYQDYAAYTRRDAYSHEALAAALYGTAGFGTRGYEGEYCPEGLADPQGTGISKAAAARTGDPAENAPPRPVPATRSVSQGGEAAPLAPATRPNPATLPPRGKRIERSPAVVVAALICAALICAAAMAFVSLTDTAGKP